MNQVTPLPPAAAAAAATAHKALWVFTPSRTDPKDLEFILVQRQALLQDAVERVGESALTEHKHHLLFVGPRGCGKTHLVTLIISRLSQDPALADRLRIAWLNEDETCTTLLEWLLKIHAALVQRYPAEYHDDNLSQAYDLKPDAAHELVAQQLLAALGPRTLLVIAENLDALFDGLGDVGQKKLRGFIQEHPKLSIVATAQRLVEDLSSRSSPFFGFFQTEHLKTLTADEARQLLQKIAQLQGKHSLVAFLATSQGRSRVRALHHLSGGNHRIYIVLSQFITRDSIDDLLAPFMKMVDELTPYYQERIRWLAPLQRKIVEYLCHCQTTVPVKDIAKRLFASAQTISSQLQDLREKGYVSANQRGRESLYEISEPLMRICVEVKDTQQLQPLRLLVDFLRVWYDDPELKHRLGELLPAGEPATYLELAIQRNHREGNLRRKFILDDYQSLLSEKIDSAQSERLMGDLQALPEAAALAMQLWAEGKSHDAQQCLTELLAAETEQSAKDQICEQVARALNNRGVVHEQTGETQRAIDDYTAVIALTDAPAEQAARALTNRGFVHIHEGETQRAIDDYTTVIGMADVWIELVASARLIRGLTYGQAGNAEREIDDYTAVIALAGAPAETIATAQYIRGLVHFHLGRKQESQLDFEAVVENAGSPLPRVVDAHLALAELHFSDGRWSDGFAAIEASLAAGDQMQPVFRENAVNLVERVFSAGLSPQGRRDKVAELLRLYDSHNALAVLGEALVKHVGSVFRAGPPYPASDNLDGWAVAWEQSAINLADFSLSLRLHRTGIDFVKIGGQDRGLLLSLPSPERAILEQSLGLS